MSMDRVQAVREIRNAIKQGDSRRAIALIESDPANLEIVTPFGTWLQVAASFGNLELVRFLVSKGADINRRSGVFDAAPIKEAASEGRLDVVQYLLSEGANLDVTDPERNPLFGAIYGGHLAIAKLLVENGIDVFVKYSGSSMKDMDAVSFARERGQLDIAVFLEQVRRN